MGDFTTAGEVESVTAHEVINNILTLQFNGYMTDTEVVNIYRGVPGAKFTTLGTREAPCIIEVMPLASMQRYVISGFGEDDIILSNLTKGEAVTIDGKKGTVTENGVNKFDDCDIWEFPILVPGVENSITFSSAHCDITVRYNPMWL